VDAAALARQAVADGADLLGVAGGDGTQALVAGIAAEHDLPFLVISAGTRNHFALDLGLDRDNPAACLDALADGVEQRIDLGVIGGRTFVNNASFGAYAEIVESPAYRDDKLVVEKTDPGVSFGEPEKKLGIKGSPTRTVILDDARIPADRIIGAEGTGFKTALATLDHTRITIAAQALGIAQGALDYATGYVQERRQFGQAIADFQGVQFMLADMAMRLEAARQLTYHAAALSEQAMAGAKIPNLTFVSSACKTMASDAAMAVTTDAVQLLGGYGYTRDFPVERMMRDAKITQIYEGTNQVQRMVMARQLLRGHG
jgi:alkylation response protein AidB-like acyl-CoA dehydrogenase